MYKSNRKKEELEKITKLLFPELKTVKHNEEIYQIDYSVDMNLESALEDLRDGKNDKVAQDSINYVLKRLIEVRKILQAYPELDDRSRYVIVDCLPDAQNEIEAVDD